MSLPLRLRKLAQIEYHKAVIWYEAQRPGLGTAFFKEVEAVLGAIADDPDAYPVLFDQIREAPVDRFPYSIFYKIMSQRVMVLSVFHNSRDPAIWQSRN
jgi:plasmid stabilization system protein ParE